MWPFSSGLWLMSAKSGSNSSRMACTSVSFASVVLSLTFLAKRERYEHQKNHNP